MHMKEIRDIISAYQAASSQHIRTALATVVHVEGSSYRRPGARMLVTENGHFTGAISGGCLEGDALRKAQLAIYDGKNKLVTYDTSDEDDVEFGVQLGCNGIIHILFEPVHYEDDDNPVLLLTWLLEERNEAVIATLFTLKSRYASQPGTCLIMKQGLVLQKKDFIHSGRQAEVNMKALEIFHSRKSQFTSVGNFDAFFEFLPPSVHLVIAGAGNDAIPLTEFAKSLGWKITVFDGRFSHATAARFPLADQVLTLKAEEITGKVQFDAYTVCVLMTHNYQYDLSCLRVLIRQPVTYIGSLGPRKKLEKMLDEISKEGILSDESRLDKIHGPVGLDIGAETSEEIALAIMAEIKAVISGRRGTFLKNKNAGIHDRDGVNTPDSVHKTTAVCTISQDIS